MALETPAPYSSAEPTTDYGSDWDDDFVDELVAATTPSKAGPESPLVLTDIEDYEGPKSVRLPKVLGREFWATQGARFRSQPPVVLQPPEVCPGSFNKDLATPESHEKVEMERVRSLSVESEVDGGASLDEQSPLQRFRTPPKKALSVTDLISPAWCELQYSYTLSKHGRKKRTPAMKQGTKIHKQLEDEVHTTVPVSIQTKEDGWGLRIWNVIQSLRTLQETGRTREMEVWGVVDGEFVNGIIDELSYTMPDPKGGGEPEKILPQGQRSIADYLTEHAGAQSMEAAMNRKSPPPADMASVKSGLEAKVIYLSDLKTRASKSVPDAAAALPTQFQLFLYYHFLQQLALGHLPLQTIASRYDLNMDATFSDEFIVQVGGLNDAYFDAVSSPESNSSHPDASQDSMDLLLNHNTLSSLWGLMLSHIRQVFVRPSNTLQGPLQTRISPVLTATYLSSGTSELIGHKVFAFDEDLLDTYLRDGMQWWRGERPAKGVELSEVGRKCRYCEFRDECEWLQERDLNNLRRVREKWREKEDPSVV